MKSITVTKSIIAIKDTSLGYIHLYEFSVWKDIHFWNFVQKKGSSITGNISIVKKLEMRFKVSCCLGWVWVFGFRFPSHQDGRRHPSNRHCSRSSLWRFHCSFLHSDRQSSSLPARPKNKNRKIFSKKFWSKK